MWRCWRRSSLSWHGLSGAGVADGPLRAGFSCFGAVLDGTGGYRPAAERPPALTVLRCMNKLKFVRIREVPVEERLDRRPRMRGVGGSA